MLMLGLGTTIQTSSQSAIDSRAPGTAWTETSHSSGTTPNIRVTGTPTQTVITLFIDNTNDWSGSLSDYSLVATEVNNVTDSNSSTANIFNFTVDDGESGGVRTISTDRLNFNSLVGALRNKNITVTGNLNRSGYASPQLTASITY